MLNWWAFTQQLNFICMITKSINRIVEVQVFCMQFRRHDHSGFHPAAFPFPRADETPTPKQHHQNDHSSFRSATFPFSRADVSFKIFCRDHHELEDELEMSRRMLKKTKPKMSKCTQCATIRRNQSFRRDTNFLKKKSTKYQRQLSTLGRPPTTSKP